MSILDLPVVTERADRPESVWSKIRYHLGAHPLGSIGAAIMAVFVFCAVFADFITVYGPTATDSTMRLLHPGAGHVLGTDQMGATSSAALSMARASRLRSAWAQPSSAAFSVSRSA